MSTKTNANAHAIISNMNKFKIGDGYTYKDICMICKIKEYKSGSNSRNKQMGTFNELFNIEESKRGKAVIYTIISKKEITDNKLDVLVSESRGRSEGSRNNYDGIFKDNLVNSFIYFCFKLAEQRGIFKDENVDDFCITTSKHNMMCEIGIRNRYNTYIAVNQPYNFCNQLGVERIIFNFAMTKINNNTSKAFDRVISSAVKLGLVIQENNMSVVRYKPLEVKDDIVVDWIKTKTIKDFAKKNERIDIELMRQKFAKDMNFKTVGALYSTNDKELISKFHSRINEYTVAKYGILESYRVMELHMKKSVVSNYLQKFDNITLQELIEVGNQKFIEKQYKNFKNMYENYFKKGYNTKNACVQGMKNYLEQADKIIYYLLDINSNKLDFIIGVDLTVDMVSGEIIEREEEGSFENFKLELKENSYVEAKVN